MARNKITGLCLGIASGDALGMPVETQKAKAINEKHGWVDKFLAPEKDNEYHGHRVAGETTDDWSFSHILFESLIAKGCLDMDDISAREIQPYTNGLTKADAGKTIITALEALRAGKHWSESGVVGAAGNGVAMKIAPMGALLFANIRKNLMLTMSPEEWIKHRDSTNKAIVDFALMTHKSSMAVASAFAQIFCTTYCLGKNPQSFSYHDFLTAAYRGCVQGEIMFKDDMKDKLSERMVLLHEMFQRGNISDTEIIKTFKGGNAYVYNSLPFSYAFFLKSVQEGNPPYNVINAGGDTDTNGSIAWALWGALYGADAIPEHLKKGLKNFNEVMDVANRFCDRFGIE